MNSAEIIKLEEQNRGTIHLFLEGIFWEAYQVSAFLLAEQVTSYKVIRKNIKAVGCEVASVGFPRTSLLKLFKEEQLERLNEKQIQIKGFNFNEESYALWFASLPVQGRKPSRPQITDDDKERVLYLLSNFRVEASTPLDCMRLIIKTQRILDGCI